VPIANKPPKGARPSGGAAAPQAEKPEKPQQVKGSCEEFARFVNETGVRDAAGERHPRYGGWTWFDVTYELDLGALRPAEAELERYHCPHTDTYYLDAGKCARECKRGGGLGLGGHSQSDPNGATACKKVVTYSATATNTAVVFAPVTKVSVLAWDPPAGASKACLAAKRAWDAAVATHEQHHVAEIKKEAKSAAATIRTKKHTGTGATRKEALARLKSLVSEAVEAQLQELVGKIKDESDKFHASPAGGLIEFECKHCG
jgi:hypothetical protein